MFHNRRQLGGLRHPSSGAAVYQGIGDVTSAVLYLGLRAYTLAQLTAGTTPAVQITGQFAGTHVDFFPKASNGGFVDSADVQTYLTANGGGFAYTRQVYDLTGGGAGVGNTLLDTTNPRYNLSGVSASVGTVDFVSSNVQRLSNNSSPLTRAQPFTIAAVAKHTTTNSGTLYSNGAWAMQYKDTAVNQVSIYAGAAKIHATANDGTFNSVIIVVNGSSSKVVVNDGTPANSTAIGTAGSTSGDILNVGQFGSSLDFFDGSFCEFAIIAGAASAGTITALYQNQRTAYGNIF